MHRYLGRVAARPLAQPRPAKVVVLEARRQARKQAAAHGSPPPKAA